MKQRFKRTVSCNKCRSELITQPKTNNLDYRIDPTFKNINRLFVLSVEKSDDNPRKDSFDGHCTPLVKMKDFNALICDKPFFHQLVKNKQEPFKKLVQMSRNDDFTTGHLSYY